MPRGPSGRVVIELDPELKRELHSALVADGRTLKEWFITSAQSFLEERRQLGLPGLLDFPQDQDSSTLKVAEDSVPYRVKARPDNQNTNTTEQPETDDE